MYVGKYTSRIDPMGTHSSSYHLKCYELRDNDHDHLTLLPGDGVSQDLFGSFYFPKLGEMIQFY